MHARRNSPDLAIDEVPHALQFAFAWRIVAEKFIGKADRAERHADNLADVTLVGDCELATAATEVDHQRRPSIHAEIRYQPQVNEPRFLDSGNRFHAPAGRGVHPLDEGL